MSWPGVKDKTDYRTVLQYLGRACLGCGTRPSQDKALLSCSRCKRARYCGAGCQRADYAAHKDFCFAYGQLKDWTSSLDTTPNRDAHLPREQGDDGPTPRQDAVEAFANAFVWKGQNALLASLGPKHTKVRRT